MPPLPVVVGSLLFLGVLLVFKMSFVTAPGGKGIAGRVFGPVINLPAIRHTASVIMLHGLVSALFHLPLRVKHTSVQVQAAGGHWQRLGACRRRS